MTNVGGSTNDLAHKVKMLQQDQNKVLADQATVDRLKAEAEKMHREYTEKLAKLRDVMATV